MHAPTGCREFGRATDSAQFKYGNLCVHLVPPSGRVCNVNLPGGDFEANLGRLRVSSSFTPRIFVQGLVQYNDSGNLWSTNLRFAWLWAANTGLFVVYNETRDIHYTPFGIPERSFVVKISRLFDVFN